MATKEDGQWPGVEANEATDDRTNRERDWVDEVQGAAWSVKDFEDAERLRVAVRAVRRVPAEKARKGEVQ